MPNRVTKLYFDPEDLPNIAEITGNKELYTALGYLTTWSMGSDKYAFCEIIGGVYDGNPELIATYRPEERGPITYQIGAVWHEGKDTGHFGFHS